MNNYINQDQAKSAAEAMTGVAVRMRRTKTYSNGVETFYIAYDGQSPATYEGKGWLEILHKMADDFAKKLFVLCSPDFAEQLGEELAKKHLDEDIIERLFPSDIDRFDDFASNGVDFILDDDLPTPYKIQTLSERVYSTAQLSFE